MSTNSDDSAEEQAAKGLPLQLGGPGKFSLDHSVSSKLFSWQVQGLEWFWQLHQRGAGGILADDMGLGKTRQCCAFLAGMFAGKLIKYGACVCAADVP